MKQAILTLIMVILMTAFAGSALATLEGEEANTYFGWSAGNQGVTIGVNGTFIGYNAGQANSSGNSNTFVGNAAGYTNTTGGYNVFLGYQAGLSNTTAYYNNFIGADAGINNTTGFSNSFIGYAAGSNNTTGSRNHFIGYAGINNTTGSDSVFLGTGTGNNNTVENNNTLIGNSANINGTTPGFVTNATAIGSNAYVSQPNSLILGSIAGVNEATSSVNVGIGTPAPARQLHLAGDNAVFRMDRTMNTAAFIMVRTDTSGSPMKTFVVGTNASSSGVGEFVINDLGTAVSGGGTNRFRIDNTGTVYVQSLVQTSSMAYKDNVRTYENALDTVSKLRGVKFDWKDSGKPSVGLIAEEVETVIPEVVAHNNGNATGVNYASLVGVLVEAVKEQQGLIKELQARNKRIEQLELKNEQLEQRLLSLEAQ